MSTDYSQFNVGPYQGVWMESFETVFLTLFGKLNGVSRRDKLMLLKFNSCRSVSALSVNIDGKQMNLILKRYGGNYWCVLRNIFRRSSARKALRFSNVLRELGLPVSVPLGYFEKRKCGVLVDSGIISEKIECARLFYDYFAAGKSPKKDIYAFTAGFAGIIRTLHVNGIFHSDIHSGNILISDGPGEMRIYILDFDRMKMSSNIRTGEMIEDLSRAVSLLSYFRNIGVIIDFFERYSRDNPLFCHRRRACLQGIEKKLRRDFQYRLDLNAVLPD